MSAFFQLLVARKSRRSQAMLNTTSSSPPRRASSSPILRLCGVAHVRARVDVPHVLACPGHASAHATPRLAGRFIAPEFDKLSVAHPDVTFVKVDIDQDALASTVRAAGVSAVPTFLFTSDSKKLAEVRGADLAGIKAAIDELK